MPRGIRVATRCSTSSRTTSSISATSISRASDPTTATRGRRSVYARDGGGYRGALVRHLPPRRRPRRAEGVPLAARALQRGDRGARVPPARVPRRAAHPGRDRGAPLRLPAGRSGSSGGAWASTSRAWRAPGGCARSRPGATWPLRERPRLRPEQLPPPARAEEVERAPEELHLARRHRPPVDLGLHAEAVDDHALLRAELADAALAVAGADAALLPAAHRHLGDRVVDHHVVHAHRARLYAAGDARAARQVPGPHAGVEAVARVVGQADRLLLVADAHDRDHRPEGLVAHDVHLVVDVDQHGRLEEEAGQVGAPLAARQHLGAARDRVLHVALDLVDLGREGHGADLDHASLGRALADLLHLLDHLVDEGVVDRCLDVDALDRDADLAGVREPAVHARARGPLQVRVAQHDHRILAAEHEGHRLEELPAALGDLPAGGDAAGEADHIGQLDQVLAGLAVAGHHLEDVLREAGRAGQLGAEHGAARRHLGGLDDHGVARHERRDRLADGEVEGEVPGSDDPDHPVRQVAHVDALVLQEVGPGGLVGQVLLRSLRPEADRVAEEEELVGDDVVARLPGLARDDVADAVLLVDEAVADVAQDPRPSGEPQRRPGPLRLAGAGDRPRDRLAVAGGVL